MARGIKRANTKSRPERSRTTPETKGVEADLEEVKVAARERLTRAQGMITDLTDWVCDRMKKAMHEGDVDEIGKLQKIIGDAVKRDLMTLSKRPVGRPSKTEKLHEGVPIQDRAGLLESLAGA